MPVDKSVLDEIALSEAEYRLIVERLGREPNSLELGLFGALWSEHCGYKHSKLLLRTLPGRGRGVLIGPGEENAGAVDIGGGWAAVMKVESHNHPSAVEPFEGAATGVGGIVRDIFAMGARPIALMNSLRFGPLSERRNRYLFHGVVGGIASYGNCMGIPDVGGEIYFAPCYSGNPLVNALCLGIVPRERLVRGKAGGEEDLLLLVGADTGRDGLHGASGLASRTFEDERELRSAVQVGNPFMEKLLMEACLELAETGLVSGIQDLGAAGLTSASVEAADRGGGGMDLDVDPIPRREQGMTPYELMLAESQERMLLILPRANLESVLALLRRWGLTSALIGKVTGGREALVRQGEEVIARLPVKALTQPPVYHYKVRKPAYLKRLQAFDLASLPVIRKKEVGAWLLKLLAAPDIASKETVYRQYDHQVGDGTVFPPGGDAAVLRVPGTPLSGSPTRSPTSRTGQSRRGLALSTDGNGRLTYLDPFAGGAMAVAEAARNVVCTGARPQAITNCLNFGNPERPDVFYQLKEAVRGMAAACRKLRVSVISGNVSLYNESQGQAIYPTLVVGMLGVLPDLKRRCPSGFRGEGDMVLLLGPWGGEHRSLAGSLYLEVAHDRVAGRPHIDLDMEGRLQRLCLAAIRRGLVRSAHDCSDGGLAVALAEACIMGEMGFRGESWKTGGRLDAALFGEAPSRIVVSVSPQDAPALEALAARHRVPATRLGATGGQRYTMPDFADLSLDEIAQAWRGGLAGAGG
jgi:phosphoribosylformylglycinamidine synthase